MFYQIEEKLREFKLDVAAFQNPAGRLDVKKLGEYLQQYDFFKVAFQKDLGIELAVQKEVQVIIAPQVNSVWEAESRRIWLNRSDLEEMVLEIRNTSPEMDGAAAEALVLATLINHMQRPKTTAATPKEILEPRRDYSETDVVMVAKRAKQFALFAETYAKHALLKAKALGTKAADGYATEAQTAWCHAKNASEKAALAAVAAVKSGDVAEAVQVAAMQAEEALRSTVESAQAALDAANLIFQDSDQEPAKAPTDTNIERLIQKIQDCLALTRKSAERAELFAGYTRTYIEMAAFKSIIPTGTDVGRQGLHFAEIAATAAAQAMMTAQEARACAQQAGFPKFLTMAEQQKIEKSLNEADQKAGAALATAVEAAANTEGCRPPGPTQAASQNVPPG